MAEIQEAKAKEVTVTDEIRDAVLKEAETGLREWEFNDTRYVTRNPNTAELNEANWAYSAAFNRALMSKLPTQSQMDKMLRERGVWTDEDDKELEDLREKIHAFEHILSKKDTKDKSKTVKKMVTELAEARAMFVFKNGTYTEYMSQTVEAKAEEAKQAYLISKCTTTADGECVWPGVDEFLTDRNAALVNTATYQFITFSSGLAPNYIEQLPEVQFLRAGRDEDGKKSE